MAIFRRKSSKKAIRARLTRLIRAAQTFDSLIGTHYERWQTPAEARPPAGGSRPLRPEDVDRELRRRIADAIQVALRPHLGEQRRLLEPEESDPVYRHLQLRQGRPPRADVKVFVEASCEGLAGSYIGLTGGHGTGSDALTGALVVLVARLVVGEDGYLQRAWQGRVEPRERIVDGDARQRAPFIAAYEASGFEEGLPAWIGSLLSE